MAIKITGVGSYIPQQEVPNNSFLKNDFYTEDGQQYKVDNDIIIKKFKHITVISERRYAKDHLNNSDIGAIASEKAIQNSNINAEELDYIIVAHNYWDVAHDSKQSDAVPSIASRIKQKINIKNPSCVAYDILFGCPGWVEGMIQANAFIKAGIAKKFLIVGTETLSRVTDRSDRDAMIFSDGAAAVVLEKTDSSEGGMLAHESATYAIEEANYIYFGESFNPEDTKNTKYIKMLGRKIYEFALTNVPLAMKACLDK